MQAIIGHALIIRRERCGGAASTEVFQLPPGMRGATSPAEAATGDWIAVTRCNVKRDHHCGHMLPTFPIAGTTTARTLRTASPWHDGSASTISPHRLLIATTFTATDFDAASCNSDGAPGQVQPKKLSLELLRAKVRPTRWRKCFLQGPAS